MATKTSTVIGALLLDMTVQPFAAYKPKFVAQFLGKTLLEHQPKAYQVCGTTDGHSVCGCEKEKMRIGG
ncbi:hypothetical protein OAJ77_00570 [Rhodospirillales bacterium]|nr:hypothetical protein [Rhodospirillales bacterium]